MGFSNMRKLLRSLGEPPHTSYLPTATPLRATRDSPLPGCVAGGAGADEGFDERMWEGQMLARFSSLGHAVVGGSTDRLALDGFLAVFYSTPRLNKVGFEWEGRGGVDTRRWQWWWHTARSPSNPPPPPAVEVVAVVVDEGGYGAS